MSTVNKLSAEERLAILKAIEPLPDTAAIDDVSAGAILDKSPHALQSARSGKRRKPPEELKPRPFWIGKSVRYNLGECRRLAGSYLEAAE